MGTKILVFLVVAFMGGAVLSGLLRTRDEPAAGVSAPSTERTQGPERTIARGASELHAGPGIWSAWRPYPPRANVQTTVLWRVEGTQPQDVVVGGRASDGTSIWIKLAPTRVIPTLAGAGLEWRRPGVEWGSKLLFPRPGVWTVEVRAGTRLGRVTVRVVK